MIYCCILLFRNYIKGDRKCVRDVDREVDREEDIVRDRGVYRWGDTGDNMKKKVRRDW